MSSCVVVCERSLLAKKIAKDLGFDVVQVELGYFSDSESIVKIENPDVIENKTAVLAFQFSFGDSSTNIRSSRVSPVGDVSLCPPKLEARRAKSEGGRDVTFNSINDQLMQFLFLVHQVKLCGAKKIIAVCPYLAYGRQVESVDGLRAGPLQALGSFYRGAGVDKLISCDIHEELCESTLDVSLQHVTLEKVWENVLRENLSDEALANCCFLSPDKGGVERANNVAQLFGARTVHVEKKRVGYDKTEAQKLIGDVKDRVVILIDDIAATGRTAVHAAQLAAKQGAERIVACFTHAVLSGEAVERLEKSDIEKIWVTNSIFLNDKKISDKMTVVSIDDYIINALRGTL